MTELTERLRRDAALLSSAECALKLPIAVLLGEAMDVVGFCRWYWRAERSPQTGALLRPGLELAGEFALPADIVDEIGALERLTYDAHRSYVLAAGPVSRDDGRARSVVSELSAALEWAFDDARLDGRDARLARDAWDVRLGRLREQHERRLSSHDALAAALDDYAGLAELARDILARIPAFDACLVAEARALAQGLRERSTTRDDAGAARALALRNRYATLLLRRMQRVRRAARFVFRKHPDIAQRATSRYERQKRNAARRKADAEHTEHTDSTQSTERVDAP